MPRKSPPPPVAKRRPSNSSVSSLNELTKPPAISVRQSSSGSHIEAAEEALLESLEARRGRVRTESGEVYRTAMAGDRPLLSGSATLEQMYQIYDDAPSEQGSKPQSSSPQASSKLKLGANRFKDIAKKVMQQQSEKRGVSNIMQDTVTKSKQLRHKRSNTINVHSVLESIIEDGDTAIKTKESGFFEGVGSADVDIGRSQFAVEDTHADKLVQHAMAVEKLLQGDDDDNSTAGSMTDDEELPLLGPIPDHIETYNDSSEQHHSFQQQLREHRVNRHRRTWYRKVARKVVRCCSPVKWYTFIKEMILSMHLTAIALCFCAVAWICYYYLGNPHFDFMPGPATLSWWFNFAGRQLLTLELARATQYIFIDVIVLGSKYTVQFLGPLVTLWALQAKGWPLLAIGWGVWDLLLLHGDNAFQVHWFHWTGIAIYSKGNSGSYILHNDLYLRFLISVILAGALSSVKRAAVAIHFGRRTFAEFKPRLEKILKDIVLVSEVADLAEEAERITHEQDDPMETAPHHPRATTTRMLGGAVSWEDDTSMDDDMVSPADFERKRPLERAASTDTNRSELSRSSSGRVRIRDLLDRWQEPINKLEKTNDASISDILRFRRALVIMDEDEPFGSSFGDASTRDACIESAHHVYARLLKLEPGSRVISNDIMVMLAQEDDGTINTSKKAAMRRLFRPDRMDQIPMLAFIQSVDSLYRKLRYFRASVGNASVIDHALEQMMDSAFGFGVSLIILTVMRLNPWPLLVSMSTLLVSFSFAMGASASKYIEGVLLISVRRPFDLGDRIVFTAPDVVANPGAGSAWLVEDMNLYTTTLRYALTNEIATLTNGTFSGDRIVNLNRSPNAICWINLKMHVCIVDNDALEVYKAALEKYVVDHPRVWDALVNFRYNSFDNDNESCVLHIAVRHRNSWQEAPRVMRDWGEFQLFIHKLGETMDVGFDSPPNSRLVYQGGILKKGAHDTYKRLLLGEENVIVHADIVPERTSEVPGVEQKPQDKDVSNTLFLAQLQTSNNAGYNR